MLRKAIFCGLVLLVAAAQPLPAQTPPKPTPKPSPSPARPQPGDREFTQAAARKLVDAAAAYRGVCWSKNATLEDMEKAYKPVHDASDELGTAFTAEFKNIPEMREQRDLTEHLWRVASDLAKSKKDYEAELKASAAYLKAEDKLAALEAAHGKNIMAVVDPENYLHGATDYCLPHKDLLKAKADAEHAAFLKKKAEEEKAEAEKKPAQKTATGPAKKPDDCNKGLGINGVLEKLACDEGKK